jgi:hypothetical protein
MGEACPIRNVPWVIATLDGKQKAQPASTCHVTLFPFRLGNNYRWFMCKDANEMGLDGYTKTKSMPISVSLTVPRP